jgi:hypothetical protein
LNDWNALDGMPNGLHRMIQTEYGTLNDLHGTIQKAERFAWKDFLV